MENGQNDPFNGITGRMSGTSTSFRATAENAYNTVRCGVDGDRGVGAPCGKSNTGTSKYRIVRTHVALSGAGSLGGAAGPQVVECPWWGNDKWSFSRASWTNYSQTYTFGNLNAARSTPPPPAPQRPRVAAESRVRFASSPGCNPSRSHPLSLTPRADRPRHGNDLLTPLDPTTTLFVFIIFRALLFKHGITMIYDQQLCSARTPHAHARLSLFSGERWQRLTRRFDGPCINDLFFLYFFRLTHESQQFTARF